MVWFGFWSRCSNCRCGLWRSSCVRAITSFKLFGGSAFLDSTVRRSISLLFRLTSARSISPVESDQNPNARGMFWAYITTFLLTITNPLTILSFIAIFTSLGYVQESSGTSAPLLIIGVFLGSACWWLLLSSFIGIFRHMINKRKMLWINISSGFVLILYGVYSISRLLTAI
jgi:threonine/homoserine/homoserine lactone efflux protein